MIEKRILVKFIQTLDTEILNPNDRIKWIFSLHSVKTLNWPFQQYFDPQSVIVIKCFGGGFFSKLKNDLTLNSAQNSVIYITNVWHDSYWWSFKKNFKDVIFWPVLDKYACCKTTSFKWIYLLKVLC